jgi:hypothetical protein
MKHEPIDDAQRSMMNALARALDDALNGNARPKKVGFALLTYNFDDSSGHINYIGNGRREDVLTAIKELAARWEGRYTETNTTQ